MTNPENFDEGMTQVADKPFNLSDRIAWKLYRNSAIGLDELYKRLDNNKKQFIKELKDVLAEEMNDDEYDLYIKFIDKLAGESLTK